MARSDLSRDSRRHGACPRGATTEDQAANRGPAGTSPAAAIGCVRWLLAAAQRSTGTSPVVPGSGIAHGHIVLLQVPIQDVFTTLQVYMGGQR